MLNYIENLRKKPEAERRKKVFTISLSITLVIAVIWGVSLFIYKKGMPEVKEGALANMPSLKETFASFGDQVGKIFKNTETYSNETPVEEAPYYGSATTTE